MNRLFLSQYLSQCIISTTLYIQTEDTPIDRSISCNPKGDVLSLDTLHCSGGGGGGGGGDT